MMRAGVLVLVVWAAGACAKTQPIFAGSDLPFRSSAGNGVDTPIGGSPAGPRAGSEAPVGASGSSAAPNVPPDAAAVPAPDAAAEPMPPVGDASTPPNPPDAGGPDAGTACTAGRADCDGDVANGCEADLDRDSQHCGECGRECHADGANVSAAMCVAGECRLTCQFAPILGDCDGDPDNGCETDLWHDADNCSVCGKHCNRCVDGACR